MAIYEGIRKREEEIVVMGDSKIEYHLNSGNLVYFDTSAPITFFVSRSKCTTSGS